MRSQEYSVFWVTRSEPGIEGGKLKHGPPRPYWMAVWKSRFKSGLGYTTWIEPAL